MVGKICHATTRGIHLLMEVPTAPGEGLGNVSQSNVLRLRSKVLDGPFMSRTSR